MLRVFVCLTADHDYRMVAGAALVCAVACSAGVALLLHSRTGSAAWQIAWRALAATVFGTGVWATHFIATLAFDPGLPLSFDLTTTVASAIVPVLATCAGFTLATAQGPPWRSPLGGALIGAGVGVMHYLGTAAWRLPGSIAFAPDLVTTSLLFGTAFAAALWVLDHGRVRFRGAGCAVLLMAAVLSLHFTGMGAVVLTADPGIAVPPMAIGRATLAVLIGITAVTLFAAVLLGLVTDVRSATVESQRLHGLADAAFEGIAVCEGMRIREVNAALAAMTGLACEGCRGSPVAALFPPELAADLPRLLKLAEAGAIDTMLMAEHGPVPVELRVRLLAGRSRPSTILVMRDLRERIAAEARIRHMAHHDPLTGLANRALLHERMVHELAACRRSGKYLAVCCIDLDRFKAVNDSYGHAGGDALLLEVSRRLMACVRETDIVARLGGDEFVIVQAELVQPESSERLAERIIALLAQPFDLGQGQQAMISGSMGIAIYPDDGGTIDSLMVAADLALYRVKEAGRNQFAFFQPDMDASERDRRALEQDVRMALELGQFSLAIQPQANLHSGRIVGFEALLRWAHPHRGQVPPDRFIPAAEASGAIVPIGAWVLTEACRMAATWHGTLRVAVNVSPLQLRHPGFPARVAETLAAAGLDPARLELEITESALIHGKDGALQAIRDIRALGVRVAMDDFGTGTSSLGLLRSAAFDRIKLDQTFMRDIAVSREARAIVDAAVIMARGLGIAILAEGIEEDLQMLVLREAGVDEVQGYLIGRPGPPGAYRHITHPAATLGAAVAFSDALPIEG